MTRYQPRFASTVNRQRPTITRWCGPGILSVLSGEDYDDIEIRVNKLRGDKPHKRVTGMMLIEMKEVIEDLGLVWVKVPVNKIEGQDSFEGEVFGCKRLPTLITYLRTAREARGEDVYMILTTDHVLLAKGEWIVDNCVRTPIPYELTKYRRRERVVGSFCILKDED